MSTAVKEYGGALYDLAVREGAQDVVRADFTTAAEAFKQQPQYVELLQNPALPKAQRLEILGTACEGLHPYVVNFLKILCEKSALKLMPGCLAEYTARYYADKGILPVTAESAVAMTEAQQQALRAKLEKLTGKTILLENKVDAALGGGVRITYAGTQIDGTVKHRLEALRAVLLA